MVAELVNKGLALRQIFTTQAVLLRDWAPEEAMAIQHVCNRPLRHLQLHRWGSCNIAATHAPDEHQGYT